MDVMKPELVWVENRCYRNFEGSAWAANRVDKFYTENESEMDDGDGTLSDVDIDVEQCEQSKFKHSFRVAKDLFRFIVGGQNATRKRIENETRTQIIVPKPGQDGDIVIIGANQRSVISARHRIDLIIAVAKDKINPTHFLSIPLNTEEIIGNFEEFKKDILGKYAKTSRGVEENIFQTPSKLHMTLGILTLLDDEERNGAVKTLQDCAEEFVKPFLEKHGPISVKLKGVQCMNDDPAEVNVLYAKVDSENTILQSFVDGVIEYFSKKDLIRRKRNNVKMHVTLMNTMFPIDRDNYKGQRKTFDAQEILSAHKDTVFGEIKLTELHLSQLHTKASNGYYQSSAIINFP